MLCDYSLKSLLISLYSALIIFSKVTCMTTCITTYVLFTFNVNFTVPNPTITVIPYNLTFGTMVGPQGIQCIVSTVSAVELSSVMISWMGPGGESITNDSRVTISPTTSSGNNYTSNIQFAHIIDEDEGMYTCNVMILETTGSSTREVILNGNYSYSTYNIIMYLPKACVDHINYYLLYVHKYNVSVASDVMYIDLTNPL